MKKQQSRLPLVTVARATVRALFDVHSLRWRLQLWHALILAGVIAGLCVLAQRLAVEERVARIDRELNTFEHAFVRHLRQQDTPDDPNRARPTPEEIRQIFRHISDASVFPLEMRGLFDPDATDRVYLVFWDRDGSILFRSANAPADLAFPPLPEPYSGPRGRTRGSCRELVRVSPDGFRGVVGRDVSSDMAALSALAWQIAACGTGLWLLGLFGGWWLAGRAIRPINVISGTANRIAGGNLSERIDVADTDNDLGQLSMVLNETFDRLEGAIRRQREFTADASHELRTPLTVMLSETTRGLKRERTTAEYREILTSCADAATRMRALVEDLLVLARQDDEPADAPREACDLAVIAADAVEFLKPLAGQRQITLRSRLDPAPCVADPQALSLAVVNLISNAIRHQEPGGEAAVNVSGDGSRAILEVIDTGPGIAPEHLPRLFDRFYRVDPARATGRGRTGLGLAIAKAVADNHHGVIEVESRLGQGSCFRLVLPRRADDRTAGGKTSG